jgi:hypothetical protein
MVLIYAFVAFLFFKIFPELAGYASNTVVGALLMGAISAVILKAAEMAVFWRVGEWIQSPPSTPNDEPKGLLLIALLGVAVSVGSTFLIGIGFSDAFMRSAFKGYQPDPTLFWAMAAIPPMCHAALRGASIWRAVKLTREARREADLTFD